MSEELHYQEQNHKPPLVTIAMPVFNAGKYLKTAVLSIVEQTFTDWELLIIDDGSTDNALQDIVDIDDPRIMILRDGTNRGLANRLNEAIDLARGQYLARMDQDDVSYPERLEAQVKALQDDTALDMIVVRAIAISENDEPIRPLPYFTTHDQICARPWRGFYLPHPTWMGRIDWFRKHRYALSGPYFCEDQELLLRSYCVSKFGAIDKILFGYRIRSKVDWKKLVKTRWTVLGVQLSYFMRSHQLHFILLSIATFIGRVLNDLWRLFIRLLFQEKHRITAIDSSKWRNVLGRLIEKPNPENE
jgi:glycosyltransferase involved in cell wall biosynthesis